MRSARPADPRRASARVALFALLAAALVAFAVAYVLRARPDDPALDRSTASGAAASELARVRSRPHLLFLETAGDEFRRLAAAPLDDLEHRVVTDLVCQRVYWAGGRGLALGRFTDASGARIEGACILDASLSPIRFVPLDGIPSRVRVARDGSLAAATLFVYGDSYAAGAFSTRTWLVDLARGEPTRHLEEFALERDGARVDAVDVNYWGVTFQLDADRYLCTMSTGGLRHLVEGSRSAAAGRVVGGDVECPSLSPGGRRVAFKQRVPGSSPVHWRPAVLDLATGDVRALEREAHSVDDQIEWLDERTILYARLDAGPPPTVRPDVWALDVDGASDPRRLLHGAMSPCVVRD